MRNTAQYTKRLAMTLGLALATMFASGSSGTDAAGWGDLDPVAPVARLQPATTVLYNPSHRFRLEQVVITVMGPALLGIAFVVWGIREQA